MKKIILILLLFPLFLSSVYAYETKNGVTLTEIYLQSPTISGEFSSLTLNVLNDNSITENVFLEINPIAMHMSPMTVDLGTLQPNHNQFVFLYLNYPQPGNYDGEIIISWDGGNNNYEFEANVLPNPDPHPPVIHPLPTIIFNESFSYTLNLDNYVTDVNGDEITWSSESDLVTFENGLATFSSNQPGNYFVDLTAHDGTFFVTEEIEVIVLELPSLNIIPSFASIFLTEEVQLTATGGTSGNYVWSVISGTNFCSVSDNGLVTGIGIGTCTVQAQDIQGLETGEAEIEVKAIPNLVITPQDASIYVGEEIQLTASIQMKRFISYLSQNLLPHKKISHSSNSGFTWSIVEGACSVSVNGLVTGLEAGTCLIRVDDNNSPAFAETNVFVLEIPEIEIVPSNPEIYVSESVELIAQITDDYYSCLPNQMIGDVNNDGQINVLDVILLALIFIDGIEISGDISCMDLNNDGEIDALDIILLVSIIINDNEIIQKYNDEIDEKELNNLINSLLDTSIFKNDFTWSIVEGETFCSLDENIVTGLEEGTCLIRVDDNNSPAYAETNVFVLSITPVLETFTLNPNPAFINEIITASGTYFDPLRNNLFFGVH